MNIDEIGTTLHLWLLHLGDGYMGVHPTTVSFFLLFNFLHGDRSEIVFQQRNNVSDLVAVKMEGQR